MFLSDKKIVVLAASVFSIIASAASAHHGVTGSLVPTTNAIANWLRSRIVCTS